MDFFQILTKLFAVAVSTEGGIPTFSERAMTALTESESLIPWMTLLWIVISVIVVVVIMVGMALVLIYGERKIGAHFQCRLGPMRVGFHGILQPIADTIKIFIKEDIVPAKADVLLHTLAPALTVLTTILLLICVPYASWLQVVDFNIGIVYFAAITGIGVLGILLGGWSSYNKWSLLGAMRAGAQVISYELTATITLLVIVIFSGSLSFREIVMSQQDGWWIWRGHAVGVTAFVLFFIASVAELNRTPFDIPESESEIGSGFHTEYSGIRFGLFFVAEFVNMFIACGIAATLFLGGWMPFHIAGLDAFNNVMDLIPGLVWFGGKSLFLVFVMMWFRWTFPRLRVDQLMRLEWKCLLPISFITLFAAAIVVLNNWYFFPIN